MRTLLVTFLALFLLAPVSDFAEAKRLGGGSKIGKSFSAPKKSLFGQNSQKKSADNTSSSNTNNAAKSAAPAKNTVTKKRSGFGGLMAGLLAGGLFGALLFGGAFEGIEFMDLLLIAGVIFVVWKIFSMRKRPAPQQSYAGAGGYQSAPAPQPVEPVAEQPQAKQSFEPVSQSAESPSFVSESFTLPTWFNKESFLDGARGHFGHLQAAWDRQDWQDISTYTSEEVLEALKAERAKLPAEQHTEVVSVMAELVNCIEKPEEVIVTVNFYGWVREEGAETSEFNEHWHLSRDMTVENADWMIIGIQQPE